MGAVCCCLRPGDFEDYVNPSSSVHRNRACVRGFVQNFLHMYMMIFHRGDDAHHIPSSIQQTSSMTSTSASADDSVPDMYRSPPRPLPFDADPTCFRLQRGGLVLKNGKSSSHSHDEESIPLRRSEVSANDSEYLITRSKWNESRDNLVKPSTRLSYAKTTESWRLYTSSEEEKDVCPTCFEDYTPENPKIMTKCSHHYHLGCIYEWMERSESCPVCGKVMVFDETT